MSPGEIIARSIGVIFIYMIGIGAGAAVGFGAGIWVFDNDDAASSPGGSARYQTAKAVYNFMGPDLALLMFAIAGAVLGWCLIGFLRELFDDGSRG